jgi:hypothetical protein
LNLQRRKNTKYTFAPANRSDSAPHFGTQPIVEEIIKGKDRKKQVTGRYGALPVLVFTHKTPEKHLAKGDMITGIKKVCKVKAFCGCLCILFARKPEILSGIKVG